MENYFFGFEKLYVIGNGFDLHHGILCNYKDFRDWLKDSRLDVYGKFIRIYGDCKDDWWSKFEENLTIFDPNKYPYKVGHTPFVELKTELTSLYGKDFEDAIDELELKDPEVISNRFHFAEFVARFEMERLKEDLNEAFGEWVNQLNKPSKNKFIDWLDKEAMFLTFNYTNTLEDLYEVDEENVVHLHGSVNKNVFVLGHDMTVEDMLQRDTEQYAYERDPFVDEGEDEARIALFEFIGDEMRKPVAEIIEENKALFNDLSSIKEMTVLGFSYSPIDLPYLERIFEVAGTDIKVNFGWHIPKDKDSAEIFQKKMNLSNCKTFKF